ncbi:Methylenetetrahydrofolate reductase [Mycena sanguinolenta]|uniref:Methylenetetrahydrofolate reductase n=1 Tax=Mycena sanguinolenta TaxID=230812 RepID=A0A8H6Z4U5_9AGAR|nr:Methylenetetrahydrofolate reductase [Mycena sanguinolenta]
MTASLYSSGPGLPSDRSLDVSLCLHNDSLLSESLTLSSLSSFTSSTPPIPAGCMVPLATIIGQDGPTLSRRLSARKPGATLTSPTPPRLRTMLKEKLLVETWLNGVGFDSPELTPWGGIDNAEPTSWKSEGSLYSPQVFKTKMALARRHRSPELTEQEATQTMGETSRRSSNRNALVFERQIILNSGGQSTRVSIQASSKLMDPGVADMITELQNLNSFFKEQEAKASGRPAPPSLIVSNSHFSLPVSLESSGNLTTKPPLALAARRGKKMLPPLSVKPSPGENEYPSIPTAFLGSPSAYSPKFEFASHPNRPSMDLQQMVTSLRSQCTPLNPGQQTGVDGEADEWAFADGLLDTYSPRPFDSEFVKKPLLPDMIDYAAESLTADTPTSSSRDSVVSLHHCPSPSNPRLLSTLNPPPSMPLPPRPAQRTSVRSILKSSKSVRFASLPHERPESPESPAVVTPRPRRSLPSSPNKRHTLQPRPRSHSVRPTIPAPLYRSPPPKSTPTPTRGRQQRASAPRPHDSASSTPSPTKSSATLKKTPTKKGSSGGRHSLSRVFSAAAATKENKPSSPSPPTTPPASSRARWTLNENVLRRASIAGPEQTPTQKTRMPVPLRNILTRFK